MEIPQICSTVDEILSAKGTTCLINRMARHYKEGKLYVVSGGGWETVFWKVKWDGITVFHYEQDDMLCTYKDIFIDLPPWQDELFKVHACITSLDELSLNNQEVR